MGKEIGKYDNELADRLERIRKQNCLSQEGMALLMNTSAGVYKRYIYKKAKVPAEKLVLLADNLGLDLKYLVCGRQEGAYDFVRFWETADMDEVANMFYEAARACRDRAKKLADLSKKPDSKDRKTAGKDSAKVTKKNK